LETHGSPTPVKLAQLQNVKTSDFKVVYCNNVAFMNSFFDLAMTMGEIVNVDDQGVGTVEQSVRVVMSMPHAKVFMMVLLQQIQQYEQRFGLVPLPPMENLPAEMQEIIKQEPSK